ncbi:MAG: RAMP superfamily CRISPR-associated protein [Rivularia sp. (in: cyanobacteria)]
MKAITFYLYTKQPLLATSFQGDPNSDVSYSYIPGSMIRGAMIGRYMKHHRLSELDLESEENVIFFDSKKVKYLNAYLLSQKKQRTLPIVRSWFRDKDIELSESEKITNIPAYDFSVERNEGEPETPKFVGEGFWTVESGCVRYYKEKRRINIHNRRELTSQRLRYRTKGRSSQTTREGEIFRYDTIDAGQTFQAVIVCEEIDTNLLELLKKSSDIWLGGSQSAGYGHTQITDIQTHDNWNEVNLADNRTEHEHFTITLLSDLILRDEWGQYAVIPPSPQQASSPLTNVLEKALSRILELDDIQLQAKESFTTSTLIGGFNRKWGLPLPQVPALAAGSVFVFEKIEITAEQIQQLEAEGLGERKIDGFGRIAVNLRNDSNFQFASPNNEKPKLSNQPQLTNKLSRDIATRMVERLLQEKLEQKLKKELSYLSIKGDISNSQLSRLQLIARQALPTGNCDLVLTLLNNLPSNANGQFERAKINNESFKQKLTNWLKNPESWTNNKQDLTAKISKIESTVNPQLDREYTLRLIIAVAKKAMKERK